MSKKRVFISHISSESLLAVNLKENMRKHFLGLLDVFVSSDRETIKAGSRWLKEIDSALKSTDLQIVLCSKESVIRPWVNFEAGAVWLRGIPVVPVCHSGMQTKDLPSPLGMLEGIECSHPDGLRKLYDVLAKELNVGTPEADFTKFAAELKNIENEFIQARNALETVVNPRILCASSEQYGLPEYGFDFDIKVIKSIFPNNLVIERNLTGKKLRGLLTSDNFDIVHLVLKVDSENGDLVFNSIDKNNTQSVNSSPDIISARGFANLLRESNTKLVVLATCNSLLLAVEVAHVTNMAASESVITYKEAGEWEECFYGFLAQGKSLFKSFELARSLSNSRMKAIRNKDIAFRVQSDITKSNDFSKNRSKVSI